MTKKDLFLLLLPGFAVMVIGVGVIVSSALDIDYYDPAQPSLSQQKHDRLVNDVESGKRQASQDEWLKIFRSERKLAKNDREFGLDAARTMRVCGWGALVTAIGQTVVVFSVRGRCKKP